MSFLQQKERLERMHQLIKLKATGTPKEFADKLKVSESALYELLNTAKKLGADICYSRTAKSYFYAVSVVLNIGYSSLDLV